MASVKVAVRVRPMNKREQEIQSPVIVSMTGNVTQLTNTKLPATANESFGRERVKQFAYDYSYWSLNPEDAEYSSQQKVFDDLGQEVVDSAFSGYNACVFAYGQTGSGKTYTMMGSPDNYGLTPRVCENLFARMSSGDSSHCTEISYLEIYNERVRDLLRDKEQPQLNLRVREHPKEGPYVQELSKHIVMSYSDIEELLRQGNENRTTAATNMNDHSSRSHAIFTITFTQAKFNDDIPSEIHSKIHLVDLAGSERADAAGTSGERLKEGGSINKSLVTLGNVISTLADMTNRSGSSQRRSIFIPYRDSVLTWLLKDSLGGNSRTIMIATISPAECHYAETLSTLRYAKRAKKIMNKPIVNEDPNVKLIRELRAENARLRAMLGESAVQDSVTPLMQVAETRERLSRNEEKVQELIEEWADKWQETATILQEHKTLALRKEGSAIVLDSKLPYLFCIDDDVLSTGMILYHLKEGETTIGRDDAALMPDIVLIGRGIEAVHCVIRNENGQVNLTPFENAVCYIHNILIHESTKLNQGAIIRLGRSHLFRFNDPSEAARLREEMKLNGESSLGKDMQWTWSSTSMTDSAVGSDHGDWDEYEKLEEKRRQVEQLEADHCLAEARRVSQLAAQQTNIEQLKETGDKLKRLSSCAQEELQTLSVNIAKQRYVAQQETERLISEQTKLKQLTSQLEADHASARLKQLHLRQSSEIEQARLELERNRQVVEWSELEKERQHQLALRQTDLQCAQQHLERVQKVRQIEKQTWAVELADMRRLVEDELQVMRQMAGMAPDFQRTCSPTSWASDNDTDDSIIDFESLRLKLDFDGVDGLSGLPDVYFNHSLTKEEHDVSEIFLGSPNDAESDDIVSMCCHLAEKVCGIHTHICELLQHKYSSVLSIDGNPLSDAKGHLKSVRQLFEQTQQLLSSKSPKSSLAGKLNEFNRRLSTVEIFVQIDEALINVECGLSRHSYIKVIEILDVIQTLISSLDIGLEIEMSVLKALRTEMRVAREQLIYGLGEDWNQLLRWTLPLEGRQRRPQSASLDVSRSDDDKERLLQVVAAMTHTNILAMRVKTFSERVMAYLIEPVITDCSVMLQTIEEPHRSLICVIYSSTATQHESSLPAEAFQHIVRIFTFLCAAFDGVSVKSDSNSGDKAQSTPIVTKIGKLVSKQLFDRIYNCCILPAIPHGEEDSTASWSSFGTLVSDTENFQKALSTLGVLSTDFSSGNDDGLCESLLDRLNNANVRFANLKSQELRHRAQLLMTEELIDSVHVSNDYPIGNLDQLLAGGFENLDTFVKGCREEAATPNFKLPECQISRSVCSLVSLAYEMLQEALAGSSEAAMQLCNATHCVLELYSESIPSHHQEKVTLLPLVAALHHNNCMFIAHHVVIIDKAFRQKLIPDDEVSAPVGEEYDLEPTLALLVPKMRRLGNDSFSTYIDCKKRQLSKLITEAIGLSCCADDNAASAMKLVQTLFHHFHHLGAVWFNVLSTSVYFRSIGSLLDSAISDIIEAVFTIEEFSVDDCQCLQRVIEYVSNGAVDLFRQNVSESTTSSPEVTVHEVVPSWLRIRELALLLGAGLQDIDDRWSDGKGPLALYFTGDDVARFLTAAFEKTSRRDVLVTRLRKHHNKSCVI